MVLFVGWMMFRFTSDWPRGASASGVNVAEWTRQLSYFGLVPWVLLITLVLFSILQRKRSSPPDPIVSAHFQFIAFQLLGLYLISREFGYEGFVAGVYIILVSVSFLYIYLLAKALAQDSTQRLGFKEALSLNLDISMWAMIPCIIVGISQIMTQSGRDVGGIIRTYGGTSSPNVFAAVVLVYLSIIMWSRHISRPRINLLMIIISLCLIVTSFSLSGMICLFIMIASYYLVSSYAHKSIKIKLSWIVGVIVVSSVLFYFVNDILSERITELSQSDNSLTWRTRTWESILYHFEDPMFFFFGGGLGFDHLGLDQEPHNEWLRIALETGALGVALFAKIWWSFGMRAYALLRHPEPQLRTQAAALIAATLGLLIWAFFDSVLRTAPSALLLWAFSGWLNGVGDASTDLRKRASPKQGAHQLQRKPNFGSPLSLQTRGTDA
jgi:hypothetical protein